MKSRVVLVATAAAVWMAASPVRADQTKADQQFCAAAASYKTNIAELDAMGPHSTVAELRSAMGRVEHDVSEMKKSASKMKTPTVKEFTDAINQLKKDVGSIPDDATLEQVHDRLQGEVDRAKNTGMRLSSEAGCADTSQ
jgi:hypothetical protein